MIHAISIIVGYVGGDLSTPFARDHLKIMVEVLAQNPNGPISLVLERKETYKREENTRSLFKNEYFTVELLRRMTTYPSRYTWTSLFSSPCIPPKFIEESKKGRKEFWNYPLIPLSKLRKEAKVTKSSDVCEYILSNPALFSKGVRAAKNVVRMIALRKILSETSIMVNLSCNTGAPVEFFIQNPQYISHVNLADNTGEVFRGEEEKVISFLNKEFATCDYSIKWELVQNEAVPLKYIEEHVHTYDYHHLRCLSYNKNVTLAWWNKNVYTHKSRDFLHGFASNPSVPYSFIVDNLSMSDFLNHTNIITTSYNIPVDKAIKICRGNPGGQILGNIARNRGFWIRLTEKELTPILQSFFNVSAETPEEIAGRTKLALSFPPSSVRVPLPGGK